MKRRITLAALALGAVTLAGGAAATSGVTTAAAPADASQAGTAVDGHQLKGSGKAFQRLISELFESSTKSQAAKATEKASVTDIAKNEVKNEAKEYDEEHFQDSDDVAWPSDDERQQVATTEITYILDGNTDYEYGEGAYAR